MSKTIRVEPDTHAALVALKRPDETFEGIILRLLKERRKSVREGADLWSESNAADRARDARRSMKRGVGKRGPDE